MKRLLFILFIPFLGITQTQFDYLPGGGMPIVRGYQFNIPPENFECYELTSQIMRSEFKEYDYMGIPINEYHTGLTFRIYSDGRKEQLYK
jgi:hypothetical protein